MTVVELSKSYTVHGVTFDKVTLREPTYKDVYIDALGLPFEWQVAGDGNPVRLVYPDVIDDYVRKLATAPTAESLTEISAIDAQRLATAICGFFIEEPKTSQTASSSGSDGTQAASKP